MVRVHSLPHQACVWQSEWPWPPSRDPWFDPVCMWKRDPMWAHVATSPRHEFGSYNEMSSQRHQCPADPHTHTLTSFIQPFSVPCVRMCSSKQPGSRAHWWPRSVSCIMSSLGMSLLCRAWRNLQDKTSLCCQFNYSPYYCRGHLFSLSQSNMYFFICRELRMEQGDVKIWKHLV